MSEVREKIFRGAPVALETNGYLLKSLVSSDVTDRFVSWMNTEQMKNGLNLPDLSFTRSSLASFITSFDNHNNYFIGIFSLSSGLLVGFYTIDVNRQHRVGSLTTGVGEEGYQGKGVLWATIDALIDDFYGYRGIDKFTARIISRNFPMLFNFINNPRFCLEGVLKRECYSPQGRLDVLLFASYKV